jgi:hypothetical protein
VAEGSPQPS